MSAFGGNVETPIPHHGVFIDVVINLPGSTLAGLKVRGLIDTGADFILVSKAVPRRLQLKKRDETLVGGIGGDDIPAEVYSGAIRVPDLGFEKTLPLYSVAWGPTTHTVLLGRSFLRYFVFRYDGPSEVFHFSKPING